ncbi:MAG: NAD(P)H-dependent oxidoreductase [Acidobacteriaceae bacterium]|nr:NAD(P)H-dependent oxidoreductase [Acidobacteriaceae bacterium]
MEHIVIVVGHPRQNTLCEALAQAYARGARSAGHEVQLFVLSRLSFDPILHSGFETIQPLEPDLAPVREALLQATCIVFLFPLWLGDMPALMKGFLERILQPDLVVPAQMGQFPKLLKGKRARVIVTMGMPGLVFRFWFRAHALKLLRRNILEFLGAGPVRATVFGNVMGIGEQGRERWLKKAEALGQNTA